MARAQKRVAVEKAPSTLITIDEIVPVVVPKVLQEVGNAYNHVESRLTDVQNKRMPMLERQIARCAKIEEIEPRVEHLKKRLDSMQSKEAGVEHLSTSIRDLEASHAKVIATADATATKTTTRIDDISTRVERLEADTSNSKQNSQPDGASLSSILEKLEELSGTVKQLQAEKEADTRTIRNLEERVNKLSNDGSRHADRIQNNAESIKKLQVQQNDKADRAALRGYDERVTTLEEARDLDLSSIETAVKTVNGFRSQLAEKANKMKVSILEQKVKVVEKGDKERTAAMDTVSKDHKRLEDRLGSLEQQLKQVDSVSRKSQSATVSIVDGLKSASKNFESRLQKLESRPSIGTGDPTTNSPLFKRLKDLESRDAFVTQTNAKSQALLNRVERLVGDDSKAFKAHTMAQELVPRVQQLEELGAEAVKTTTNVKALVDRLDMLEPQGEDLSAMSANMEALTKRLETVEARHKALMKLVTQKQNLAENASDRASNRPSSAISGSSPARDPAENIMQSGGSPPQRSSRQAPQVHLKRRAPIQEDQPPQKRAKFTPKDDVKGRTTARPTSQRKELSQEAGAPQEESEEEDSDEEIAPRRTSRQVRPTERGSHLGFLDRRSS